MAIQTRRGNESDFDPNRMVPGEWATATDTEKVWMCFKTGKARRMATYEDMVENIGEATEEIKAEFTAGVKSATEAAAGAANTANKAAETASNASNTANAAAETAMNAAEKAEAAAGGDISEKTVSFEEVETYSKPTSGSKISSIIANLVMGISQLFSNLANKIDSSKILSTEEWGAAISERGYLADAKDIKGGIEAVDNKKWITKITGTSFPTTQVNGNQSTTLTKVPDAVDGYTCVGVTGFGGTDGAIVFQAARYNPGSGKLTVKVRNTSSTAASCTPTLDVLYVRSDNLQ